ncbi:uncharacterized protein LOC126910575 [Daktulosphaira vitifoliae]|uniref:uncharacterized protein LOC126910575 n=1 Tax=Daktulosphaira vitifoliae TaxID=58002 RepID=UPI0021AA26FB|nr:uncharacterized protein LOC126910575 [Daktulosphaira vitifoliae]
MIFEAYHKKFLYIGPQGLLANIRAHFWPLRGRDIARITVNKREIIKYYAKQRSGRTVYDELLDEGIQWIFIPPSAPHFGGVWEAAVKSCKYHLVRTILGTSFNFEELCTVLAQVEACLNSRPLTPLSSDPCDFNVLTPSHFLIGGPAQVIPEPDLLDIPANRVRKWSLMQKTMQDFWRRWRMEYLSSLQVKNKWLKDEKPIPIGSLAILKEDNAPPLKWPMVRIEAVHPGKDKIV